VPDRSRDDGALPLNAPRLDRVDLEDPVFISDLHLAGANCWSWATCSSTGPATTMATAKSASASRSSSPVSRAAASACS